MIAGQIAATMISRYPIDCGLTKFGVTPNGGGKVPVMLVEAVEFIDAT